MSDEDDLARPRVTPTRGRRRPAFAQPPPTGLDQPLGQLAPRIDPPWTKEDTDTPDRTALYTHPEGHRIGLRLQGGDLIIQTWISAGPNLPAVPDGTAAQQAAAQAANDARLQPGRTWHRTIPIRHTDDIAAAIDAVLRDGLIRSLTTKPKRIRATTYGPAPEPSTRSQQTHATQKEGTPR
ncbi:hypothetical protein [Streptomyces sp. S.PNR 29]|uniref:hypothetical protein n=1 Tax=Streptomyces sp. S.PNR 29 TaxID=2973805 RepID=UPI0025B0357F|nr:hypothetical protein [Streptomyces sp. S.PNR 29]MDN0193947.1 hypothetical protein [Streptomyces sp. S.PNR 29]